MPFKVRPAPRVLKFRDDACYLVVGGLKGLCGNIAVDLAKNGAKYLAVVSRSGYDGERSQIILHLIRTLGAYIDLLRGDITILDDVKRVSSETAALVGDIILGAMVLIVSSAANSR
jgi:NAD(P)-dependent dehydrogenase (short-subunit alcohol dehydrogenase family)